MTRLRTLPPPPMSKDRIRQRSFSNNDLLLSETSDFVLNDHAAAVLPSPLESVQVDETLENAVDGAKIVMKRRVTRRSEDRDDNEDDYGIEEDPNDVTEVDWKRSSNKAKRVEFPAIHAMLVEVTADVVAATAQIGEGDRGGTVASTSTSTQCEASLCSVAGDVGSRDPVAGVAAESPLNDIPQGTSSTMTDDLSIAVAATGQT